MLAFSAKADFPNWRGDCDWRPRARAARARLLAEHHGLAATIAARPFEQFERVSFAALPSSYHAVPKELADFFASVPAPERQAYLSSLLLWLMDGFEHKFAATGMHAELALHYADAFNRIVEQIDTDPSFADLAKDAFMKDLWLARVVMIPAFAQVWWPHSGLALSDLLRAGPSALTYGLVKCGGRRPFFEGHTHDPMARIKYWNANGWFQALRLIALALPAFPKHKGAFGTAWFYDPAMATVSPNLLFASDLQVGKGAFRLRVGPNEAAHVNATATSASRRKLVAEGKYQPADYSIIWARKNLLAAYGPDAVGAARAVAEKRAA